MPVVAIDLRHMKHMDRLSQLVSISGEDITLLRKSQGLSMEELASVLGVSSMTVWRWENGRSKPQRCHIRTLLERFPELVPKDQTSLF